MNEGTFWKYSDLYLPNSTLIANDNHIRIFYEIHRDVVKQSREPANLVVWRQGFIGKSRLGLPLFYLAFYKSAKYLVKGGSILTRLVADL